MQLGLAAAASSRSEEARRAKEEGGMEASVGGGWPVLLSSCSCSGRRRAPARGVEGIFTRTGIELEVVRGRRRLVVAAEEGRWSRGRCGVDGDDLVG